VDYVWAGTGIVSVHESFTKPLKWKWHRTTFTLGESFTNLYFSALQW
jgi:hypothetical protein